MIVLYVGAHCPQPHWHTADSLNAALGMYITYLPEVMIFDAEDPLAREVFDHIATVTEFTPRSQEFMLVVNSAGDWQTPPRTIVHHYDGLPEDWQEAIEQLSGIYEVTP